MPCRAIRIPVVTCPAEKSKPKADHPCWDPAARRMRETHQWAVRWLSGAALASHSTKPCFRSPHFKKFAPHRRLPVGKIRNRAGIVPHIPEQNAGSVRAKATSA